MRVWMYPKYNKTNKYNELFSESIEKNGIQVIDYQMKLNIKDLKVIKNMRKGDIFHIHWPSFAYQSNNKIKTLVKIALMIIYMNLMKLKGVKIAWTVHNLYPHEMQIEVIEKWFRKFFIKKCDILFALGESIKKEIISKFNLKNDKVTVVKHGHYFGYYKKGNRNYRKELGLNNNTIFLFIGQIRPYKGIEDLVDIFSNNESFRDKKLIIAGKPNDKMKEYLEKVKSNNIIKILEFLTDEKMIDLIDASDYVVLPYKNITTSGSAILATSYSKPIIIPDNKLIRDYFDEKVSILFETEKPNSLINAMRDALNRKGGFKESDFNRFRDELDWDKIGLITKKAYEKVQ